MLLRYHGLIPSICEARSDRDTQIEDDPPILESAEHDLDPVASFIAALVVLDGLAA